MVTISDVLRRFDHTKDCKIVVAMQHMVRLILQRQRSFINRPVTIVQTGSIAKLCR